MATNYGNKSWNQIKEEYRLRHAAEIVDPGDPRTTAASILTSAVDMDPRKSSRYTALAGVLLDGSITDEVIAKAMAEARAEVASMAQAGAITSSVLDTSALQTIPPVAGVAAEAGAAGAAGAEVGGILGGPIGIGLGIAGGEILKDVLGELESALPKLETQGSAHEYQIGGGSPSGGSPDGRAILAALKAIAGQRSRL